MSTENEITIATLAKLQQSMDCHERAHGTLIEKFRVALEQTLAEHPSHPAIPEEVRKAIEVFIDEPCRCVGMVDVCPDCDAANVLRDWIAKCPTASDKPKDESTGIYRKYRVERLNDPTGKHDDCSYFVLDWRHDKFTQAAMAAYAQACEAEFSDLAKDIRAHLQSYFGDETAKASDKATCPKCGRPCVVCERVEALAKLLDTTSPREPKVTP